MLGIHKTGIPSMNVMLIMLRYSGRVKQIPQEECKTIVKNP
jgi:hypothetical protein